MRSVIHIAQVFGERSSKEFKSALATVVFRLVDRRAYGVVGEGQKYYCSRPGGGYEHGRHERQERLQGDIP